MVLTGTKWFGGCGASSSSSGFFVSGMAMLGLRGKLGAELHGWSRSPPCFCSSFGTRASCRQWGWGCPWEQAEPRGALLDYGRAGMELSFPPA